MASFSKYGPTLGRGGMIHVKDTEQKTVKQILLDCNFLIYEKSAGYNLVFFSSACFSVFKTKVLFSFWGVWNEGKLNQL